MTSLPLHFTVLGDDFTCAGEASSKVKNKLKQLFNFLIFLILKGDSLFSNVISKFSKKSMKN